MPESSDTCSFLWIKCGHWKIYSVGNRRKCKLGVDWGFTSISKVSLLPNLSLLTLKQDSAYWTAVLIFTPPMECCLFSSPQPPSGQHGGWTPGLLCSQAQHLPPYTPLSISVPSLWYFPLLHFYCVLSLLHSECYILNLTGNQKAIYFMLPVKKKK